MDQKTAAELLQRYRDGHCTKAEEAMVHRWYAREAAKKSAAPDLADPLAEETLVWQRIQSAVLPERTPGRTLRLRRWLPYVAAGLILAFAGTWLLLGDKGGNPYAVADLATDVAPGGNKATLTLANGQAIDLSAQETGIIVGADDITYQDGRSTVALLNGGALAQAPQQLVLSTPKGGTYSIVLPDGTEVWLNAASTLKYPSRFGEDAREVEIVGEAYFAVAKDAKRPFRVISASQTVEVLGTRFNISAYPDEPDTKTTLVEGSVRLSLAQTAEGGAHTAGQSLLLAPDEQGIVRGGTLTKTDVDVTQHIAWRDGLIVLDHADLAHIIRQLERWYDVEFIPQGPLPADVHLSGKLPRNSNLSGIVHALHINTKMNFTIEGRRVMVNGN